MIDWIVENHFGLMFTLVVTSPFTVGVLAFSISQWRWHRRNKLRLHELSDEEYSDLQQMNMSKGRR
jgi:hypothetical protein